MLRLMARLEQQSGAPDAQCLFPAFLLCVVVGEALPRMANFLVPVSFLGAAIVYGATRDWQRVLNLLFIDSSCGLKLSTATAISAAINPLWAAVIHNTATLAVVLNSCRILRLQAPGALRRCRW